MNGRRSCVTSTASSPTTPADRAIDELVRAAVALLRATGDPTAAALLSDWPASPSTIRQSRPHLLPVLAWIDALESAAVPATRALVGELVASARSLTWAQTYGPDDFGASFLERYGWTELIGLRGPVASTRIAAGFLLLGPAIEYPSHCHDTEELYLPLAGSAHWQRDGGDWTLRPPGVPIFHPSQVAHAMRTEKEPLLALYVWRGGDLTQKSRIL